MGLPRDLLLAWLLLLASERVGELARSARNVRGALAAGGVEHGRRHYPAMLIFHGAFLAACALEPFVAPRPWPLAASVTALLVALLAQALRWWAILTLGPRWMTRVVVVPGAPPITWGPYRLLRHPNYLAVSVELLAVPLIGGAVYTAAVAAIGNALLLSVRIPIEERALGAPWERVFGRLGRLLPGGRP